MTDQHFRRDADETDRGPPPRMPRWVKVFGIVAASLILLMLAAMLIIGGKHGPGRHLATAPPRRLGWWHLPIRLPGRDGWPCLPAFASSC